MALNKVTYTNHQTVISAENLNAIQDEIIANAASISGIAPEKYGFAYGTCSTAESTTAKTATITGYQLVKNGYVAIRFTNAVPAGSSLNINSLGAKAIYWNNSAITAGVIRANSTGLFVYDGSYYRLVAVDYSIISGRSLTSSDNLDDIRQAGTYWCNSVTGRPLNYTYAHLIVWTYGTTIMQSFVPYMESGIPKISIRHYVNNAWRTWKTIQTAFSADSTVSLNAYAQFAGVWTSTTELRFIIPLSVPVSASSVSLSGGMYVRTDGTTTAEIAMTTPTVTTYITDIGIVVRCVFSSTQSGAKAYMPCMIQPANMVLTFA